MVSDLTKPGLTLEEELMKWFGLAEDWQAIVLLDEADVFLERRSSNNIFGRNGLVASKFQPGGVRKV